mmetsp:Transcript_50468/g.134183  ORF Transcript_50468/g.134183 Transcript_50468/m.134183 type:complete len:266 (+) Transcript_50468:1933-2730(+)
MLHFHRRFLHVGLVRDNHHAVFELSVRRQRVLLPLVHVGSDVESIKNVCCGKGRHSQHPHELIHVVVVALGVLVISRRRHHAGQHEILRGGGQVDFLQKLSPCLPVALDHAHEVLGARGVHPGNDAHLPQGHALCGFLRRLGKEVQHVLREARSLHGSKPESGLVAKCFRSRVGSVQEWLRLNVKVGFAFDQSHRQGGKRLLLANLAFVRQAVLRQDVHRGETVNVLRGWICTLLKQPYRSLGSAHVDRTVEGRVVVLPPVVVLG